jgi:outer membrane lipoprotein carrier protein
MHIRKNLAVAILLLAAACGSEPAEQTGSEAADTVTGLPSPVVADSTLPLPAGDSTGPAAAPLSGGALPSSAGETRPERPSPTAGAPASATEEPAAPAQQAPSRTSSSARDVLLRAERAYDGVRTLRADFVQELSVPLLASAQQSRGQIFHRKPDRFLMRFSDPAGDVVVADGTHVWMYYPSSDPKQVIRTSGGEAGRLDLQREFLSNPTERFNATLDGKESVDGRPATALTLVPRGQSPYRKVRIWVDDRDGLVRRFEISENNDNVRRVELHGLQANTSLADDLFTFTPPAGTQVFDQ